MVRILVLAFSITCTVQSLTVLTWCAVETRNRVARELQAREKEKKEQELRELAMRARAERGGAGSYAPPPAAARYSFTVLVP